MISIWELGLVKSCAINEMYFSRISYCRMWADQRCHKLCSYEMHRSNCTKFNDSLISGGNRRIYYLRRVCFQYFIKINENDGLIFAYKTSWKIFQYRIDISSEIVFKILVLQMFEILFHVFDANILKHRSIGISLQYFIR